MIELTGEYLDYGGLSASVKAQVIAVQELRQNRIIKRMPGMPETYFQKVVEREKELLKFDLGKHMAGFANFEEKEDPSYGDIRLTASLYLPYVQDEVTVQLENQVKSLRESCSNQYGEIEKLKDWINLPWRAKAIVILNRKISLFVVRFKKGI